MRLLTVKNRIRIGVLAALAGCSAAPALAETVWTWNYTGVGIEARGTFSTGDVADASGFYDITSIAGERNGVLITGLYPAGTSIPGNEPYVVDNLVRVGGDGQLTVEGFGFALASGAAANPYFADFLPIPAYSEVMTSGAIFSEVPIVFSASPVPEPSTAALLLCGVVGVAAMVKRNRGAGPAV